jgi:GNAT superfamily N-acetyltransferase
MMSVTRHDPVRGLRPLVSGELQQFAQHLLRLDRESRRNRFNGTVSDDFIAAYVKTCATDGVYLVAYYEGGVVRAAAELHSGSSVPEVAFSVEPAFRRRGLGSALFRCLLEEASNRGHHALLVTTGPGNDAMRSLAGKFGASLSYRQGETSGIVDIDRQLGIAA